MKKHEQSTRKYWLRLMRGVAQMDTYPDDGDCRCSNCKVCIDALHRRNRVNNFDGGLQK